VNEPLEKPSKTQRKNQMIALQKMGEKLVSLSVGELQKIPLDSDLAEAIMHTKTLKGHEAIRRQMQYIGRLMRHTDPVPIQAALEAILLQSQQGKAHFHQIERWRDQLITEGDTQLQPFVEQFPHADVQHLRQLIRHAQQERLGATKELFRYLKEIISS